MRKVSGSGVIVNHLKFIILYIWEDFLSENTGCTVIANISFLLLFCRIDDDGDGRIDEDCTDPTPGTYNVLIILSWIKDEA